MNRFEDATSISESFKEVNALPLHIKYSGLITFCQIACYSMRARPAQREVSCVLEAGQRGALQAVALSECSAY
jgi:hypothetical protein